MAYTIETAIEEARSQVFAAIGRSVVCTDMIKGRNNWETLSAEEWNEIVSDLYCDTIYWETY